VVINLAEQHFYPEPLGRNMMSGERNGTRSGSMMHSARKPVGKSMISPQLMILLLALPERILVASFRDGDR
jgi:hypothetical protein